MKSALTDGLPVAGYRPQPARALELVNANKLVEERVLRILDDLAAMPDLDKRWLAIGRTEIERGFMAVNRAIFQPSRVAWPDDAGSEMPPSTELKAAKIPLQQPLLRR